MNKKNKSMKIDKDVIRGLETSDRKSESNSGFKSLKKEGKTASEDSFQELREDSLTSEQDNKNARTAQKTREKCVEIHIENHGSSKSQESGSPVSYNNNKKGLQQNGPAKYGQVKKGL